MYHPIKRFMLLILGLCLALVLSACGRQDNDGASTSTKGKLVILGSTALQPLVEEAARQYMGKYPQVDILVQGGGSGTGMTQVSAGTASIGMSDITLEERPELKESGLVDHQIAMIGFALVVNPQVNVTNLTKAQVKDIFTGKITNWSALGGTNQTIIVINRPEGSGTRSTFNRLLMDGQRAVASITQESSGSVRKTIADTPGAIGYLSFSYLNDSIKVLQLDGVTPTVTNVLNKTYTFWAYEHLYTKGPASPLAQGFIDFILSADIQTTIVPKVSFISIPTDH